VGWVCGRIAWFELELGDAGGGTRVRRRKMSSTCLPSTIIAAKNCAESLSMHRRVAVGNSVTWPRSVGANHVKTAVAVVDRPLNGTCNVTPVRNILFERFAVFRLRRKDAYRTGNAGSCCCCCCGTVLCYSRGGDGGVRPSRLV
jgi:hypothetical protein